jgi:hypothetical protein
MSFECSYAGVGFDLDVPDVYAHVNTWIPFYFLREIVPIPQWPGRQMMALAFPQWPMRPPLVIGDFFYPTGATRWGEFHGLMRRDQVELIRAKAFPHGSSGGSTPQTFILNADMSATPQYGSQVPSLSGFAGPMYLLPPRPLGELIPNLTNPDLNGWYLVTLVDERYYAYFCSPVLISPDGFSYTWNKLFADLATGMAVNLVNDGGTVDPTVYGYPNPDGSFWANGEVASLLLDAAAWNCGRVVVRNQGGTYKIVDATDTSITLPTRPPFKTAGGGLFDTVDQSGVVANLEAVLPSFITVDFPRYIQDAGYFEPRNFVPNYKEILGDIFTEKILLSEINSGAFASFGGHPGGKYFHSSAKAYFNFPADVTPVNETQLHTLALQLAENYCYAAIFGLDEVYPGSYNFGPDQWHDILWTYRSGGFALTRVQRKPWNFEVREFQHVFPPPSMHSDGPNCSPCIEVFRILSAPDPANYNRQDAQVRRWNSATHQWSEWESIWAIDSASG